MRENAIEWYTGERTISVTLTDRRLIGKVKRLAKSNKNEVNYVQNSDGSIFAHLPLSALKLSISARKDIDDSEREKRSARMKEINNRKKGAKKGE